MTKVSIKNTQQSSAALPKVKMMVKKVHQKSYQQYDTDNLFNSLLEFACLHNGTSMNAFLKSREKCAATSIKLKIDQRVGAGLLESEFD